MLIYHLVISCYLLDITIFIEKRFFLNKTFLRQEQLLQEYFPNLFWEQITDVKNKTSSFSIGDRGVGKTSIIFKSTTEMYSERYLPTLGIDFKRNLVKNDPKKIVSLKLWDTRKFHFI